MMSKHHVMMSKHHVWHTTFSSNKIPPQYLFISADKNHHHLHKLPLNYNTFYISTTTSSSTSCYYSPFLAINMTKASRTQSDMEKLHIIRIRQQMHTKSHDQLSSISTSISCSFKTTCTTGRPLFLVSLVITRARCIIFWLCTLQSVFDKTCWTTNCYCKHSTLINLWDIKDSSQVEVFLNKITNSLFLNDSDTSRKILEIFIKCSWSTKLPFCRGWQTN